MTRLHIVTAADLLDDLNDVEAMVDLLCMATSGMVEEDDRRVFGVATAKVLDMMKAITAKVGAVT